MILILTLTAWEMVSYYKPLARWERIATIALAALLVGMFLYPASSPGSRRGIAMGASGDFALAAE